MNSVGVLDLEYIFTNKFDEKTFTDFAINLVNLEHKDLLSCTKIKDNSELYKTHIEYVVDIGKYKDEKNKTILISMIKLKDSPEKSRTMQRNFIAKHIKSLNVDAALVGLYSEYSDVWRISFVKLDYTFDVEGLKEIITPAKRYSYLIEPYLKNHTAQERLGKLFYDDSKKPSVDTIEEVFSVQSVTDEFFKMYKAKYLDLKEWLEGRPEFIAEAKRIMIKTEDFSEEFAKKLMGQIAFLYFLQKKGWLGVRIVPKEIDTVDLRELYKKQDEETRNIIYRVYKPQKGVMHLYNKELIRLTKDEAELLASVFKNTKYDEDWGSGTRSFIRTVYNTAERNNLNFFNKYLEPLFYNALNERRGNTEYYHVFNCKIPFLNGGLFEPIYGYQWEKINIEVPNTFFSNEDNNGLLDLFDMYNFTINEDEPLEKEVAVDPEMLGKIFENLLEIKERKSKGAFYTPREIVHYMCQESLINYLINKTNIDEKSIELFIKYGDIIKDADANKKDNDDYKMPKVILDNIEEIDSALSTVTVVDPAVGSGAFPLGILSEIVKSRNVITEYMSKDMDEWKKEELFRSRSIYKLKKDTMKKSIFAVDIEPSAVDIAKLRLWLSLVVDADVKTVNTLPNLDYKIMVGNSLIDEYEGIKLFDEELLKDKSKRKNKMTSNQIQMNINSSEVNIGIEQEQQILEDIQLLQWKLFDIKNTNEKIQIKKAIEDKEWELIGYKLNKENKYNEIKNLGKIRKEKKKPYFLWDLEFSRVFKENKGFDIVIGNPPYIGFQKVENKEYYKKRYFSANGKYDFYVLFIEKGLKLLKHRGIMSFICPSYFYKRNYGKNIRKLILDKTKINFIVDFNDTQIFDTATTYTCIFGLEKNFNNIDNRIKIVDESLNNKKFYMIEQNSLKEPRWILENDNTLELLNIINKKSQYTFGSITKSISQGIVTGNNTIFILSYNSIKEKNINMNFLHKIYKGKDIRNGKLIDSNEYIFYPYYSDNDGKNVLIEEDVIKSRNPKLYEYLIENKSKLLSRDYFLKSKKLWYELWNPRKNSHFYKRKFVFSEVNNHNDFVLCNECYYSDSACGAELKNEFIKYDRYIEKYLNSQIITEVYKKLSVPKANGYLIYKNAFLKNLPIYIPKDIEYRYTSLVNMSKDEFNKWLCNEFKIK